MISSRETEPSYMLVFEREHARLLRLPLEPSWEIGLSEDGTLQVESKVSGETVVRVSTSSRSLIITPVGQKKVEVNGRQIQNQHALVSGDVLAIDGISLVYQANPRGRLPGPILHAEQFMSRVNEEAERARRYHRCFAVLCLMLPKLEDETFTSIVAEVSELVRGIDLIGRTGELEIAVLFPETDEQAEIPAKRIQQKLLVSAGECRFGLAVCPADGLDGDGLMTGAREAALSAGLAQLGTVRTSASQMKIGGESIVLLDPKMKRVFNLVRDLARSDLPVLVVGDTGAGKEIVAKALHHWSPRSSARLLSINCGALTDTLLESELFGYDRGAFSGADKDKPGLFEAANGGTIFLDEVCEASPKAQADLLRVLETGEVRRVGGTRNRPVDVRVVAATNLNLRQAVKTGRFREDLLFRLGAAKLVVPRLAERQLEIPVLARMFLETACRKLNRELLSLSMDATNLLLSYDWPGNIRELKNTMEYVAAATPGHVVDKQHLPMEIVRNTQNWTRILLPLQGPQGDLPAETKDKREFKNLADEIRDLEKCRITEALEETGGVRIDAAELIGMPLRTFVSKMKTYGLSGMPSKRRRRSRKT